MPKTAVVILNYNGKDYIARFLPSLVKNSEDAAIIVADNKSTDGSIAFLKENFPDVQIIALDKNHGFAGGYNEALKKVQAEYYVLLNSDIEVTGGWLAPMVDFLDQNKEYASCQPKIKSFEKKEQFEYAGACGGFIDNMGYPFCRGRILNKIEKDEGQYDDSVDVFWSSGACMVIRASEFHNAGAFDASFFAHMEEIDLCWRLHSMGKKIRVIPQSVVFHLGGGTLSYQSPFKTYLNFRNGLKLLIKNLPFKRMILQIPIRIVLDWMAAILFCLQGNVRHSVSILKAHLYLLKNFGRIYDERTVTSEINANGSILWNYYALNKRKYSDQ